MQIMRNIKGNKRLVKGSRGCSGTFAADYTKAQAEKIRQSKQTGKNSAVKVFTAEEIAAYIKETDND